jgi:hypothetical protein
MTPDDVRSLPPEELRLIVLMEARAQPRLRTSEGLWRSTTKGLRGREARPGSMTQFIRDQGLLARGEVDAIVADAPGELIAFLDVAATIPLAARPSMGAWIDRFRRGAAALKDAGSAAQAPRGDSSSNPTTSDICSSQQKSRPAGSGSSISLADE